MAILPNDGALPVLASVRCQSTQLRKQDKYEPDEQDSLLELYLKATDSAGSPQAKAA
jgi:hypothetical protein